MASCRPILRESPFWMSRLFASRDSTVTPYCLPIEVSDSPGLTVCMWSSTGSGGGVGDGDGDGELAGAWNAALPDGDGSVARGARATVGLGEAAGWKASAAFAAPEAVTGRALTAGG